MIAEQWSIQELEFVDSCPVCGNLGARLVYSGLRDFLFAVPGNWNLYECNTCKSGYINPRPTKISIGKAYLRYSTHQISPPQKISGIRKLFVSIRNDYLRHTYGIHREPCFSNGFLVMYLLPPIFRWEWDHLARHLPKCNSKAKCLLDIGCGNGDFLLVAKQAGWKVVGLDFDNQAVKIAKDRGLEVYQGSYDEIHFAESSFDYICAHQVIEHIHDPNNFVKKIVKWLKPGGILWIGTPNFQSITRRYYGRHWKLLHPPHHLCLFSPAALHKLLCSVGLKTCCCGI